MAKKDTKEPMQELNERLDKLVSFKQVFLRGVVRGVGIAIGTTIIAAILLSILGFLFDPVDNLPIIRDIADLIEQSPSAN